MARSKSSSSSDSSSSESDHEEERKARRPKRDEKTATKDERKRRKSRSRDRTDAKHRKLSRESGDKRKSDKSTSSRHRRSRSRDRRRQRSRSSNRRRSGESRRTPEKKTKKESVNALNRAFDPDSFVLWRYPDEGTKPLATRKEFRGDDSVDETVKRLSSRRNSGERSSERDRRSSRHRRRSSSRSRGDFTVVPSKLDRDDASRKPTEILSSRWVKFGKGEERMDDNGKDDESEENHRKPTAPTERARIRYSDAPSSDQRRDDMEERSFPTKFRSFPGQQQYQENIGNFGGGYYGDNNRRGRGGRGFGSFAPRGDFRARGFARGRGFTPRPPRGISTGVVYRPGEEKKPTMNLFDPTKVPKGRSYFDHDDREATSTMGSMRRFGGRFGPRPTAVRDVRDSGGGWSGGGGGASRYDGYYGERSSSGGWGEGGGVRRRRNDDPGGGNAWKHDMFELMDMDGDTGERPSSTAASTEQKEEEMPLEVKNE